MKLRDYQQVAVDGALREFEQHKATIVVLPTGMGKTVVAAHIAHRFLQHGRVLFLAHREELLMQARDKLEAVCGDYVDVEMANQWACAMNPASIVVSTIQTQSAGKNGGRHKRFKPNDFSLVIADECHHVVAASWQRIIKYYQGNPTLRVLGLTATPDRADGAALGQVFGSVAANIGMVDGIDGGWLVNIKQVWAKVTDYDLSGVRTTAGDLNAGDLERAVMHEKVLHGFVNHTLEFNQGRKTLVFASSVAHAETMCNIFNRHRGGMAKIVIGTTDADERRRTVSEFRAGKFTILVNVGVATEGFDVPDVGCVSVARPTKSRSLYVQMIGRGTRPLTGLVDGLSLPEDRREAILRSDKPDLIVLDFAGNSGRHKLVTVADVLGGDYQDDVREQALRSAESKPVDMREAMKAIVDERKRKRLEREEAERKRLEALRISTSCTTYDVDPFDTRSHLKPHEGIVNTGINAVKGKKATEKQIAMLKKLGCPDGEKMSIRQASVVIDALKKKRDAGPPSPAQAYRLRQMGFNPRTMTFSTAHQLMNMIQEHGGDLGYAKQLAASYEAGAVPGLQKAGLVHGDQGRVGSDLPANGGSGEPRPGGSGLPARSEAPGRTIDASELDRLAEAYAASRARS